MKKINFIDSIRHPIITEKATILSEFNKTVFKVHAGANKRSIKKNIEKIFKVTVLKVNIIIQKRKKKNMSAVVERIEYDPNRTGYIALIKYEDSVMN